MDCVQPSRQKTQPLPYKMFADYFEHQVAQKSSYEQAPLEFTLYCRKLKWDRQATWHGCLMTACQNRSYMVSSATANDQLVGKINDLRTPLRRPSQASTLKSPTGKSVPRIDPLWCSTIHTVARTAETTRIAEAQKKRAARKVRIYSPTISSTGRTYPCPECGRVLQARIGLISHLRTHQGQPNMTSS